MITWLSGMGSLESKWVCSRQRKKVTQQQHSAPRGTRFAWVTERSLGQTHHRTHLLCVLGSWRHSARSVSSPACLGASGPSQHLCGCTTVLFQSPQSPLHLRIKPSPSLPCTRLCRPCDPNPHISHCPCLGDSYASFRAPPLSTHPCLCLPYTTCDSGKH